MAQYAPLASHSTAQLPLYSPESPSRTPGSSVRTSPTRSAADEKALLATTNDTTDEEEELEREIKDYANPPPSSSPPSWTQRLPLRPRTIFFSLLSISILASLFLFFHPSRIPSAFSSSASTISHDATSYYSGAPLAIGLFDPELGQLASNPLEDDATFADVPFAAVGASWDEQGRKPEWAGGDAGSKQFESSLKQAGNRFWNGTNWFDRTVILVTIEGVKPDHVSEEVTPNLVQLANRGISTEFMTPVSPSLTAPNHWSILTGLYPSAHGIVANRFHSSRPQGDSPAKTFDVEAPSDSSVWNPEWYQGEPIYQTALRSDLRVATIMHPLIPPRLASPNSKPTYWYPSIARTHPRKKLAKVLQYLDESYQKRPQLFVTSFDEVEIHSRKSGSRVNTREGGGGVEKSLEMIDESFFGDLKKGLDERGLGGWVEVVVVGVTGMADVDKNDVIFLDEVLDQETFGKLRAGESPQAFEGGSSTVVGLTPLDEDLEGTLGQLEAVSRGGDGGFDVYTRDELSSDWHLSPDRANERIAPLWLVAREGSTITTRRRYEETGGKLGFKATNGYDPARSESMRTVFFASGPRSLAHVSDNRARVAEEMSNLEVYDFVAHALDIPVEARAMTNATTRVWDDYA